MKCFSINSCQLFFGCVNFSSFTTASSGHNCSVTARMHASYDLVVCIVDIFCPGTPDVTMFNFMFWLFMILQSSPHSNSRGGEDEHYCNVCQHFLTTPQTCRNICCCSAGPACFRTDARAYNRRAGNRIEHPCPNTIQPSSRNTSAHPHQQSESYCC